jgi:phosphonopyruvate decarboxylase
VSPQVSFAGVAAACGYASSIETDELAVLDAELAAPRLAGPRFVRLAIRRGTPDGLPRPTITPPDVKTRLMRHIGALA